MSTTLDAEELALTRFACISNKSNDYGRSLPEVHSYAAAIREHSQPIAEERDEYREVVEQFVQWMKMGRKKAPLKLAEKVLAKYQK